MQRLYTTNELAKDTGCTKSTVGLWADNGWVKPCRWTGTNAVPHDRFYTQDEHDRVMEAVRAAEGHPRRISIFLNRTLHAARECTVLTCSELAARCGCCDLTVRKALTRLNYPKWRNVGVLEEDVGEVKAIVQNFRHEGAQKRAMKRAPVRSNPGESGNITLHIKGLTISLDRKAAEALAEEILEQI